MTSAPHCLLGSPHSAARSACPRQAAPANRVKTKDPLEPARAALRTLQFNKAIELLGAAGNGRQCRCPVFARPDVFERRGRRVRSGARARAAAVRRRTWPSRGGLCAGRGTRARRRIRRAGLRRNDGWSARRSSATCAPPRRCDQAGRLLDRESVGASDPTLLTAWVIDCARKDDASELRRLGPRRRRAGRVRARRTVVRSRSRQPCGREGAAGIGRRPRRPPMRPARPR